jgi:hypothetical protein
MPSPALLRVALLEPAQKHIARDADAAADAADTRHSTLCNRSVRGLSVHAHEVSDLFDRQHLRQSATNPAVPAQPLHRLNTHGVIIIPTSAVATLRVNNWRAHCVLLITLVRRNSKPIRRRHGSAGELLDLESELEAGATFGAAQLIEIGALNVEVRCDGVACETLRVHPN